MPGTALSINSFWLADQQPYGPDLVVDPPQQVIPRLDEVPGSFGLERRGQRVDIDAGGFELRQRRLRVAAIGRDRLADPTMIVEGPQRRLGHRVDRVRR